jgi:hypothetical protein
MVDIPPYTSVLGQTAPADSSGVTFAVDVGNRDSVIRVRSHSLIRFVRIRRRWHEVNSLNTESQPNRCCGNGVYIGGESHITLDHLSLSWGGKALIGTYDSNDVLVSNCLLTSSFYNDEVTPSMGGYGADVSEESTNITYTRNIFYSGVNSWPAVIVTSQGELVNNLVYGTTNNMAVAAWQSGGGSSTQASYNLVGNRFVHFGNKNGILLYLSQQGARILRMYLKDNIGCQRTNSSDPEEKIVGFSANSRDPIPEEFVTTPL